MSANNDGSVHPRIYTTPEGQVVIEQSTQAVVVLGPDQILEVIKELHVCYDYCAAWKERTP
jgi:hypothetical protein